MAEGHEGVGRWRLERSVPPRKIVAAFYVKIVSLHLHATGRLDTRVGSDDESY